MLQGTDAGITNETVELIMFVHAYDPREANVINVCQRNNETSKTSYAYTVWQFHLQSDENPIIQPALNVAEFPRVLLSATNEISLSNAECNEKAEVSMERACSSTAFASYYH